MNEKINTLIYLFLTKDKYDSKRFNVVIDNAKFADHTKIIQSGTREYCVVKMYARYITTGAYTLIYQFKEHYE